MAPVERRRHVGRRDDDRERLARCGRITAEVAACLPDGIPALLDVGRLVAVGDRRPGLAHGSTCVARVRRQTSAVRRKKSSHGVRLSEAGTVTLRADGPALSAVTACTACQTGW